MDEATNLYKIESELGRAYIEAASFTAAIEVWRAWLRETARCDGDWEFDETSDPDQVAWIHEGLVLHANMFPKADGA